MASFADMLTYYRKLNGYTQRELAERINVGSSTIGMYESGKRYPTREIEEALADLFNVTIGTLRGLTEAEQFSKVDEGIVADFIFDKIKNKYIHKLYETLGDITEEEGEELIRYAEFIKSRRGKK